MAKDLTTGREGKTLFLYVLPMLGSMLFQQLYNIADTLVAGKFLGADALASVGNSYEITLIFLAFGGGMNMGSGIIIGQLFGAKDHVKVKTAITTSYISVIALSIVLTIFGVLACDWMLNAISTPAHLFHLSETYLDIYIYGLIFLFLYNVSTGIFAALGDTKTPFYFLLFSSTLNIILDIAFVVLLDMGISGLAWATFLCQGLSAILAMSSLFRKLKDITRQVVAPIFSGKILKKIISVAIPSMCQQSFVSIGNIMVQSIINSFGGAVMAGYAAAIKLNGVSISLISTTGNGVAAFAAQNIGAKKFDRVLNVRRATLKILSIISVSMCIIYSVFGNKLLTLFIDSSETEVIKVGVSFLRMVSPFYAVVMFKSVTDAVMRGAGDSRPFMYSTLLDLFLRALLSFVFSSFFGYIGIWLSWPFGWTAGTLLAFYFYNHGKWRKLLSE